MPVAPHERNYWLWVTRPEYYANADGSDRDELDPKANLDPGDWWTCHGDTRRGDLVLLYRTAPCSDIAYLLQAKSDSYDISGDEDAAEMGWADGCDFASLAKLVNPLSLAEMQADDRLMEEWSALRARFLRRAWRITPENWARLTRLLDDRNPGFAGLLAQLEGSTVAPEIKLEEDLEQALVDDLGRLGSVGFKLRLFEDPATGETGRQFVCATGGRIDILATDDDGGLVVIELKNRRATRDTFAQLSSYLGWIEEAFDVQRVRGLVVSRGTDQHFKSAVGTSRFEITQVDLQALGFE